MNVFDETRAAVANAETQLRAADSVADKMAGLLVGRLRKVRGATLMRLKKELKDFDSRDCTWKEGE